MRDKFELYCKALGLALLCGGILHGLSMIPMYFHQPKADTLIPDSVLNTEIGRRLSREVNAAMPKVFAWISARLFLQGIFPALLGWYLMRSNNFFVRTCYPAPSGGEKEDAGHDIRLSARKGTPKTAVEARGDERFAPPGYHA